MELPQQRQAWEGSQLLAKNRLAKQKYYSGVAILGKPPEALQEDHKFKGELLDAAIAVGEDMAQASLSTEYLVLKIAGVNEATWPRYIGRGQYPKFKEKPIVRAHQIDKRFTCPNLSFSASLKSLSKIVGHQTGSGVINQEDIDSLISLLAQLPVFKDTFPKYIQDKFPEFLNITPSQLDLPFLTKLVMFSHDCFSFHLNFKTNESRKNGNITPSWSSKLEGAGFLNSFPRMTSLA